ncbi:MAG TPA: 6-bladed beta-propeller [Gemmatimonadales bacterium]|nr:6-bladed beta-propeller [Gemmatimonadales bacterium]
MRRRLTLLGALGLIAACRHGPPNVPPSIGLLKVATLGSNGGAGALPVSPASIARDAKGRYVVALGSGRSAPLLIYDSTGTFLDTLGALGDGPGEFRTPGQIIIGPNDTMYVFDRARLEVFDPNRTPVRTINGTPPSLNGDAIRLDDGRFVLNAGDIHPPNMLALYDAAGRLIRTFAPAHGYECKGCIPLGYALSQTDQGTFWAASMNYDPALEHWDTAGRLLDSVVPALSWFHPYTHRPNVAPDSAPSPITTGLWHDRKGNLWILGAAANPHWARGLGPMKESDGIHYYPIDDLTTVYDLMIDEIDPDSGAVMAERRFPALGYALVIEPGLIGALRQDPDGWWYVDVYYVMSNEGHD